MKSPNLTTRQWKDYLAWVKAWVRVSAGNDPEFRELMDDYGGPENPLFAPFYQAWG
jgi:hypothetical protein